MSKFYIILFSLWVSCSCFGQHENHKTVLEAPENWNSELFAFPLSFAPSLKYTGFEDIRFAPGWRDSTSNEVWTYAFVWVIEERLDLSPEDVSFNLETYFDGLMKVDRVDENAENKPEKTVSIFMETETGFRGKIRLHDAFISKRSMTLYCEVTEVYCQLEQKNVITFKFSQQPHEDEVWKHFDDIHLVNMKCH